MTVTSTTPRADYVGNGATDAYDFDFPVGSSADVDVFVTDTDGAVTELGLGTDFTVALDEQGAAGGTVTLVAGNLTSNYLLAIVHAAALTQPTNLTTSSVVRPGTLQTTVDRLLRQVQQVREETRHAIRLPLAENIDGELQSLVLRARKLLGFDASGNPTLYDQDDFGGSGGTGTSSSSEDYNVKAEEFGALGDDGSHPLSADEASAYNTAFGPYGLVATAGDETDTIAILAALYKAMTTGKRVYIPAGTYRIAAIAAGGYLDYSARATPKTGQPSVPPPLIMFGDGYKTILKGYGVASGRAIFEALGETNGTSIRVSVSDMRFTHDVSSSATAYCIRLGDSKTGSSFKWIWMECASGILLKFASTSSYANSCAKFENVFIRANYGYAWAVAASSTSWCVNIEDGGARCDITEWSSCYFLGPCKFKAMVNVMTGCMFANLNGVANELGHCITINAGSLQLFGCYFEEYHTAVYAEASVFHIDQIVAIGCLFNNASIVTAQYGLHAKYNASYAFGRMNIIGCHAAVPGHYTACARWDQVDGTMIDCNQRNLVGDWTIQVANGGNVITMNRGKIRSYANASGSAFLTHTVDVDASTGIALGNTSTGTSARYNRTTLADGTTVSEILYGDNYSSAVLQRALSVNNSAGPLVWGSGGALDLWLTELHNILIGLALTDDDTFNKLQIGGGMRLLPQSGNNNVDGSIWSASEANALETRQGSTRSYLSGTLGAGYSDKTVANTTSPSSLLPASIVGNLGTGANYLVPGKTIRIKMSGYTTNTGTPSIRLRGVYDSTDIADSGFVAMVNISGTRQWELEIVATCRSVGATGTIYAQGLFSYFSDATTRNFIPLLSTAAVTIDTTGAVALGVGVTWGGADPANSITATHCVIEELN